MGAMPVPVATRIESVMGSLKNEMPVRSVNLDCCADGQIGQIGQMVREEALFNAVDAQFEAIAAGRRGNRVGAGLHFALGVLGHGRDKLASGEGEALKFVQNKLEVVALRRF